MLLCSPTNLYDGIFVPVTKNLLLSVGKQEEEIQILLYA